MLTAYGRMLPDYCKRSVQHEARLLPPQTFHCFPLLATELKLRIWEFAIASIGPRVVELCDGFWADLKPSDDPKAISDCGGYISSTTIHGPQKWEWHFTSPCAIPAPLHTCHLSRCLAFSRWLLSFAEEGEQPQVFFDFESDVLWFGEEVPDLRVFWKVVGEKERGRVKRIAIDFELQLSARRFRNGSGVAAMCMKEFPLLEEVVLVGNERTSIVREEGNVGEGRESLLNALRGVVTFVENVDGSEDALRLLQADELHAFKDVYRREGRACPEINYREYTREDPELFEMEDKLQWLQMGG